MKEKKKSTFMKTKVVCSCGNEFEVESNKKELEIDVCDKCHPFYTGVQGKTSKTGQIEKFNKKYGIK